MSADADVTPIPAASDGLVMGKDGMAALVDVLVRRGFTAATAAPATTPTIIGIRPPLPGALSAPNEGECAPAGAAG